MKCKDCDYWEAKENSDQSNGVLMGICHRNPPAATGSFLPAINRFTNEVTPQLMETTVWPVTAENNWCGEGKSKVGKLSFADLRKAAKPKEDDE